MYSLISTWATDRFVLSVKLRKRGEAQVLLGLGACEVLGFVFGTCLVWVFLGGEVIISKIEGTTFLEGNLEGE